MGEQLGVNHRATAAVLGSLVLRSLVLATAVGIGLLLAAALFPA